MKLLYITSLSGRRINGFMKSAIEAAHKAGFDFVMACNTCLADKNEYKKDCQECNISVRHIDFQRNPLNHKNINAYKQLTELLLNEKFDVIHCNTPIGGLIGRICAHNLKIKNVIYQAHGFHFYKGAPLKNWILYYPVEKALSRYTDLLITISKDDYVIATKKLHAKRVMYVHGVGVDYKRFQKRKENDRNESLRKKLSIPSNADVILSVGELNKNKNHKIVMDAIKQLSKPIYYVICGDGILREEYKQYLQESNLSNTIRIMGYRFDIPEFYKMADLFVFPSLREGIPGAVMEAIATGVPIIASDIRGVRDIVTNESYRFPPRNVYKIAKMIDEVLDKDNTENVIQNYENLKPYDYDNVVDELFNAYLSFT